MTDNQQPSVTPDEIADCRKELGDELAAYRNAARLTQHGLARRLLCSRSSVANIEIGRNTAPQDFWLAADRVLAADGLLVKGAGHVAELKRVYVLQMADERRRAAASACAHRADCPCSVVVARWTGRETRALREALRLEFPDFARAVNISPGTVVRLERSPQASPRLPVQAALDRVLLRAAPDARARFDQLRELDTVTVVRRSSEIVRVGRAGRWCRCDALPTGPAVPVVHGEGRYANSSAILRRCCGDSGGASAARRAACSLDRVGVPPRPPPLRPRRRSPA